MTKAANLASLGSNASTTGILPIAGGGTAGTNGAIGFKNRIINGGMTIDQRNAGASFSATNGAYSLDRWQCISYTGGATTGKYTVQRNAGSVTPPAGFINYLGVTSTAATSSSATDIYLIVQYIEGFNCADLGWGTANAQTVTVSFRVRSSVTGTFGVTARNDNLDYNYPATYTINAANTWETKTITIPGPTSGTWLTNNGIGIGLLFQLQVGSSFTAAANAWTTSGVYGATGCVNLLNTNGATFYITGVQLEVGTTATNFDFRSIGTELQLCQRYFKWIPSLQGNFVQGMNVFIAGAADSAKTMRATPTGVLVNGTNGIHVSNVATYNITSINDINDNYYRVNTNSQPGSNVPGHYNGNPISLSAEL